jgi:hypothetical protein
MILVGLTQPRDDIDVGKNKKQLVTIRKPEGLPNTILD